MKLNRKVIELSRSEKYWHQVRLLRSVPGDRDADVHGDLGRVTGDGAV